MAFYYYVCIRLAALLVHTLIVCARHGWRSGVVLVGHAEESRVLRAERYGEMVESVGYVATLITLVRLAPKTNVLSHMVGGWVLDLERPALLAMAALALATMSFALTGRAQRIHWKASNIRQSGRAVCVYIVLSLPFALLPTCQNLWLRGSWTDAATLGLGIIPVTYWLVVWAAASQAVVKTRFHTDSVAPGLRALYGIYFGIGAACLSMGAFVSLSTDSPTQLVITLAGVAAPLIFASASAWRLREAIISPVDSTETPVS